MIKFTSKSFMVKTLRNKKAFLQSNKDEIMKKHNFNKEGNKQKSD